MPTSINDLVNTVLNFKQYQLAKETQAARERDAQVGAINTFMTLARQTADPVALVGLTDRFAQLGVASHEQLSSILANVTPSPEVQRAGQVQRGVDVIGGKPTGQGPAADTFARQVAQAQLTNQNAGQLAASDYQAQAINGAPAPTPELSAIAASMAAANTTPGRVRLDAATANQPAAAIDRATQIILGLQPNAGDVLQSQTARRGQDISAASQAAALQHAWAQLNEERVHNRAGEAATQEGLSLQGQQIDNQFQADIARARAAGSGADHLPNLIATKQQLVKDLTDKNAKQSKWTILSLIGSINMINNQLDQAGVPNEGQLPYDADAVLAPDFLEKFFGQNKPVVVQPRVIAPPKGRK